MGDETRRYRPLSKAAVESGIPENTIFEWIAVGYLQAHDNPRKGLTVEPLVDTEELLAVAAKLGH